MSFPIVHSMVGYAVYRIGKTRKRSWKKAVLFSFLACAADLDYIPGVLVGNPLLFHHSITHSLGAALICGLTVAIVGGFFTRESFWKMFLLSSAVYLSNPLLDLLTSPGMPMPFLWPLQPADLAQQILTFQSLPLRCDGVKDFACGLVLNFSCVRRFWRELFCLGSALLFFIFRTAFRRLFVPSKRRSILRRPAAACAN